MGMAEPADLLGAWSVAGDLVVWLCVLCAAAWAAVRRTPGIGPAVVGPVVAALAGAGGGRAVELAPTSGLIWWVVHTDGVAGERTAVQAELAQRLEGMRDWQWRWLLAGTVLVPRRWTVDEPLPIIVDAPAWMGVERIRVEPRLREAEPIAYGPELQGAGFLSPGSDRAEFEVSVKVRGPGGSRWVWSGELSRPVRVVAGSEEAFRKRRSPELDEAVRRALRVRVRQPMSNAGTSEVYIRVELDRRSAGIEGVAVGVKIEVLRDGAVWSDWYSVPAENEQRSPVWAWRGGFNWPEGKSWVTPDDVELTRWSVRIRGDRGEALRQFELGEYWDGVLEVPFGGVFVDR